VRVAVVLTSDFAESGEQGRERQHAILRCARRHGMRLVGPNCFGVASWDPAVRLDATFARSHPLAGGLAVASQSGGVGIALLDAARGVGLGLAAFVSLGNKCDVSGNDLLAAWMEDPRVTAAAFYLESFGNPRKFARLARRFSERKPLLAVVGGRSEEGSRAGASHTAAAATPAAAVQAVFTQSGVVAVTGIEELADTAQLLGGHRLPRGRRLGIIGNAGGLGVLAADAAYVDGLAVPLLSRPLVGALQRAIGRAPGMTNPIDLGAAAGPGSFLETIRLLAGSGEVDSLLVVFAATMVGDTSGVVRAVRRAATETDVPVVLVVHGDAVPPADDGDPVPVLPSVEAATRALAHATRYSVWRTTPRGTRRAVPLADTEAARQLAASTLAEGRHAGWLDLTVAQGLLAHYGLTAPTGVVSAGPEDAVGAAERIGYPVAVKVADPEVQHKTDRKLVAVGVRSREELEGAVRRFGRTLGRPDVPVLVQPMAGPGVELAVGIVRDPSFGPVVMVAAGGVATDVWKDRVFLVPPVTDLDAARAVKALRVAPLLEGFRGSPACDVAAFEDVLLAVSRLAEDVPEIAEMDLNPVVVTPTGATCVDVRVRLAPVSPEDGTGVPRQLGARC
jgi:acyl-CoA synthetase (NDP forming)